MNCRKCGDETNAPDFLPPEWRGLCPKCTIKDVTHHNLPYPNNEQLDLLTMQIEIALLKSVFTGQVQGLLCNHPRSPGETIVTPTGPIHYSHN